MTTTFVSAPQFFLTSESVTEGHPDKICDQISDAILDEIIAQDPDARVACDCMVTTGLVFVTGEITTDAYVEIADIARKTVLDIGYDRAKYGFDGETCGVVISIKEQSADIALGVDEALEAKQGTMEACDNVEVLGAGDQGMMIGFACTETPEYMPLPISLAHKLCRRLAEVRKNGTLSYLRPDGKSQVTIEYRYGKPVRADTVLVSAQHHPDVPRSQIVADIVEHVIRAVIPAELLDDKTRYLVNPTGRFVTGGPKGDAGLTGRKIIVDTYGGAARHGGGAFSGKDPTKVDRSAAYMTRYIAKNLVAAGIAERLEVQVSYAIGVAHPISITVETFGTGAIPDDQIVELVKKNFDLRPGAIICDLDLWRPIYKAIAAYGHLGRDDLDLPWERLDRVEELKKQAGLS
ncbi:MAG: methionine adenosyltransferase [Anaerolineae bacterium]|nr:methionine adenosyltransferase [Anaerolineae bacterium]